jgi:hypothetical protein
MILSCIVLAALAAGDIPTDRLPGVYTIVGKIGDDEYTGAVVIRKRGEAYLFQSITGTETEEGHSLGATVGVGLLDGKKLSVSWKSSTGMIGVTVYEVMKDGALAGRWISLPGAEEARTERLTRIAALPGTK